MKWLSGIITEDGESYDGKSYGCFDYQGVYNVNDSIDAYISGAATVWLKSTNISYTRVFRLLDQNEDYTFNGQTLLKLVRVSLNLKIMFCL